MAKQHTLTTDSGTQSDAPAITVRWGCGNWLKAETRNQRVKCECGSSFAVTVTLISSKDPSYTD